MRVHEVPEIREGSKELAYIFKQASIQISILGPEAAKSFGEKIEGHRRRSRRYSSAHCPPPIKRNASKAKKAGQCRTKKTYCITP